MAKAYTKVAFKGDDISGIPWNECEIQPGQDWRAVSLQTLKDWTKARDVASDETLHVMVYYAQNDFGRHPSGEFKTCLSTHYRIGAEQ